MLPIQTGGNGLFSLSLLSALILPLLFIVPGVGAIRAANWTTKRREEHDRIELIFFSLIYSISSLLVLYAIGSVWEWTLVTEADITGLGLPGGIAWYLVHLLLAGLTGAIVGSFSYNYVYENQFRDHYDSWDFAFQYIHQSKNVIVKTTGGDWIHGHAIQSGTSDGTRDLLLASPREVEDPSDPDLEEYPLDPSLDPGSDETPEPEDADTFDPEEARLPASLGNYLYVNEPDIETVVFNDSSDEDPDGTLFNKDRLQARAGLLYDELELDTVVNKLRVVYPKLVGRRAQMLLLPVTVALLVGFVVSPELALPLSQEDLGLVQVSCAVGIGILGGIRQSERLSLAPTAVVSNVVLLTGSIVVAGGLIGGPAVGFDLPGSNYPVSSMLLQLVSGVAAGTVLAAIVSRIKTRYDVRPGWYMAGLMILSYLFGGLVLSESLTPEIGQLTIAATTILGVLLFVDRVQVGVAGRYNNWPEFGVNCIKLGGGFALSTGLFWGVLTSTTVAQFLFAGVLTLIGIVSYWDIVKRRTEALIGQEF